MARFGRTFPIKAHINYQGRQGIYFNRVFSRTLLETITHTDTLIKQVTRILLETITHTDTLIKQVTRILLETITHTDTFLRSIIKVLTETLELTGIFSTPASSGTFRVTSGTYVGNATDNRAITGLGFSPKFVMIKAITAGANDDPVAGWTDMGSDNSTVLDPASATTANLIQSFDADGFTIGSAAQVNTNAITYQWTAFGGDSTSMFSSSYTGNGVDNRSIAGVGFQPNVVFIKRSTAVTPFFRFSSMSGDNSSPFSNAGGTVTNRIQAMEADGFQIGTNASVNFNTGTFYYFCIKFPTGQGIAGTYTGNATDNRSITTPNFLPSFVMIKSDTTNYPVFRSSIHSGDDTSRIGDSLANATNLIQALNSTGFEIGTAAEVNTNAIPYFYIAIKDGGASATKTLTEILAHTDTLLEEARKVFSEIITHTDTLISALTTSRVFTEVILLTDTLIKTPTKIFSEIITLTDTLIKNTSRTFSEIITLTDSYISALTTSRIFTEVILLTDTLIKTTTRILTETLSLADDLLKSSTKTLIETITHTDTFTGIKSAIKTLTETITHSDVFIGLSTRVRIFTETLTLTDSITQAIITTIRRLGVIRGVDKDTNTGKGVKTDVVLGKNKDTGTGQGTFNN